MPLLTELDLNASYEDYEMTIIARCESIGKVPKIQHSNKYPAEGVIRVGDSHWIPILNKVFQDKMKVVCSQKERFSPDLFKIIEKTHFENLLPFDVNRTTMCRQEATDIFIEYAEELHKLEDSNERIETKIQELKEDIHYQVDTTYTEFMRAVDEVKEYGAETRHLLYNQNKFIQKEFDEAVEDTLDGMEEYIRKCNKRFEYIDKAFSGSMYSTMELHTKCDHLAQDISELRHDLKDIQVLTTKRINQLETKIARQISNTFTTSFILLGLFFVIQYVLSVNPVTRITSAFPLLPGA